MEDNQGSLVLLLENSPVAMLVIGQDDCLIQYANNQVCLDIGKPRAEVVGQSYRQVFWPEFIPVYEQLQMECRDGNSHSAVYHWVEKKMWEQIIASPLMWGSALCTRLDITNISEFAYEKCKAENSAYFDSPLNLPNGTKLEKDINDLAVTEKLNIIYFAIERFDEISDLY